MLPGSPRRRSGIIVIAMFVGSMMPTTSLPANVFAVAGKDPRQDLDTRDPLWHRLLPVAQLTSRFAMMDKRGAGRLGTIVPGMGTAFLVSPCYAMTSYHVLFGAAQVSFDPMADYAVRLRFAGGGDPDGRGAMLVSGRVRFWDPAGPVAPDVALIRLDRCIGTQIGWLDLPAGPPPAAAASGPLVMASISRDRSMKRLSVQRGCMIRVTWQRRGWLFHDCATREGASGAPLLAVTSDSVPLVVGMNAGEFHPSRRLLPRFELAHANWAIAPNWLSRDATLRSLIVADRARLANPLARPTS